MWLGLSGSVQRQCIRHARGHLFRVWPVAHPGTADTLLQVRIMLCELCHKREAMIHVTESTSAESPGVEPKTKGHTVVELMTSTYTELLGIGSTTKREAHYCEQCVLSQSTKADQPSKAAKK